MIEYTFMTVKELAEYLRTHPGKEVGFTSDTRESINLQHGYPEEWHGASIVDMFDQDSLVCGYYGDGISFGRGTFCLEDTIYSLLEYLRDYMSMRKINKYTNICVCKEDLEED